MSGQHTYEPSTETTGRRSSEPACAVCGQAKGATIHAAGGRK